MQGNCADGVMPAGLISSFQDFKVMSSFLTQALHERLDQELGNKIQDNANAVKMIISTLENWNGVDKGVNLMKIFNKSRTPDQDLPQYVVDFKRSQLEKLGEKLSLT